jgi:hypothetical protein
MSLEASSINSNPLVLGIDQQVELIRNGSGYVKLLRPATIGGGIFQINESEQQRLLERYEMERGSWNSLKFVPASGAATRMFKRIFEWIDHPEKHAAVINEFFESAESFPFFEEWMQVADEEDLETFEAGLNSKVSWLKLMVGLPGLNYAGKPKGLIPFHHYGHENQSPIVEHLKEAMAYVQQNGIARISFTVSPEHEAGFSAEVNRWIRRAPFNTLQWDVSFTHQKPETDTIAIDQNESPIEINGQPLMRPGGHGALIHNLNHLDADLIFIKNIDNVAHERLMPITVQYKKLLAGFLFDFRQDLFLLKRQMDKGLVDETTINELRDKWNLRIPQKYRKLKQYINRPIRVCGMVKNLGEPGGGPFWTIDDQTGESLQIVEKAQIQPDSTKQRRIAASATHFNPVDLVCCTKNLMGEKIDLLNYVDDSQYFVVEKSHQGKPIRGLEWPGLWNGAMANWITLFVEVPISTFNPVKEVQDLLRETHRSASK